MSTKPATYVSKWRATLKTKVLRALGGQCCICGYDKCPSAIDFHHLDPTVKEITFSQLLTKNPKWEAVVKEMDKCIALCANCHREVHAGYAQVPADAPRFDENLVEHNNTSEAELYDECPTCSSLKKKTHRFCSVKCQDRKRIVDWKVVDLPALLELHGTYTAVGKLLGVTGAAVKRREKHLAKTRTSKRES